MRKLFALLVFVLLLSTRIVGQGTYYLPGQILTVSPSALPATCTVGQIYIHTGVATTLNLCSAEDNWSEIPLSSGSIPATLITLTLEPSCPTGWSETAAFDGKFPLGALTDEGATGGSDTITEVIDHTHIVDITDSGHVHGELAPTSASSGAMKFAIDTNASGSQAAGINTASATTGITAATQNPAGGVASIDNRPAFIKAIFCTKD